MNQVVQRERERERESRATRVSYISPDVSVFETKDGYVLQAEMPGVDKQGLEVTLEGNQLTIIGRRKEEEIRDAEVLYRESRPQDYRRVFELDPAIDTSKIHARMEQGVLHLELPKVEKVKPRRITVTD